MRDCTASHDEFRSNITPRILTRSAGGSIQNADALFARAKGHPFGRPQRCSSAWHLCPSARSALLSMVLMALRASACTIGLKLVSSTGCPSEEDVHARHTTNPRNIDWILRNMWGLFMPGTLTTTNWSLPNPCTNTGIISTKLKR